MVNVYTNNGQFNITESLMEAIKANNPELLVERESTLYGANGKKLKIDDKKYSENDINDAIDSVFSEKNINQQSNPKLRQQLLKYNKKMLEKDANGHSHINKDVIKDLYNGNSEESKFIKQLINNEIENKPLTPNANIYDELPTPEIADKQDTKKGELTSREQIMLSQFIENKGEISGGIPGWDDAYEKSEAFRDAVDKLKKEFKTNSDFAKTVKTFKSNEKDLADYANSISGTQPPSKLVRNDATYAILNNEILTIESASNDIVGRVQEVIEKTLALVTGNVEPEKTVNNNRIVPPINTTPRKPNLKIADLKNEYNKNQWNGGIAKNIPTPKENPDIINDKINSLGVKQSSRIGGYAGLLVGGTRVSSLFKSPNDTVHLGMAIKYFKSTIDGELKDSLTDDLVDAVIDIRQFENNKSLENKKRYEDIKDMTENERKKVLNMGYGFLHNVVRKVQITDDSKFDSILRAIKFDGYLQSHYQISNTTAVKMFNVREQSLVFKDKSSKNTVLILIAMPLLGATRELLKKAGKLTRHFNNLKA